jgi:hypothetical protein
MSRDERDAPPASGPGGEGEGDTSEQGAGARVARKKGARKRKASKSSEGARGAERAPRALPFTDDYPDDPALLELVRAFEAGDYGRVRREAPALAARADDPDVARAARDLRARLDPDPLTLGLFLGTALLLAFLTAWAYGHGH